MKGKFSTHTGEAAYAIANHGFHEDMRSLLGEWWAFIVLNPTTLMNVGEHEIREAYLAERAEELGTSVDDPTVHTDVWVILHETSDGFVDVLVASDDCTDAEHPWNGMLTYLPREE